MICALFSISIQSSVKFPSPMFYSFFPLLRFCFDPPSLHPAHGYFLFMSLFLLIVSNSAASLFFVKFFFSSISLSHIICLISPPTVLFVPSEKKSTNFQANHLEGNQVKLEHNCILCIWKVTDFSTFSLT